MEQIHVLIIGGPTASGKSAFALSKALECNGVIINADSLQLYDGLPILTAQPTQDDRNIIPHFLYASVELHDACLTVMDWRARALSTIRDVASQGHIPIVVGGTGFYLKTLTEGLSPIPDIDVRYRHAAEKLCEDKGIENFFKELESVDSLTASKIDRYNRQRLIRAYEVYLGTGQPLSYWHAQPAVDVPHDMDFSFIPIIPERDVLYQRCDERFDSMIQSGALEEVEVFYSQLKGNIIDVDHPLTHALGFKPLCRYLDGHISLEEAIGLGKTETRQYAKRQVTWFKNQFPKNH